MGQMGEHLIFKLRPIASGDHGHFEDAEKVVQQSRHFGSSDDLLSASVPSRSNTISFFIPVSRFPTRSLCPEAERYTLREPQATEVRRLFRLHMSRRHARPPLALDAHQHARHARGADRKRRFSAQTPQPESAHSGRVSRAAPASSPPPPAPPGRPRTAPNRCRPAPDRPGVPAADLSSGPHAPSRTSETSRRCSAEPRTPRRRRPESEPSRPV